MTDYSQFTKRPEKHELSFEYSEITSNIFVGTDMCCQAHFEEELLKKGVNADISLQDERLDAPFGVDSFLWLPTVDGEPPTQEQLRVGVRTMDELIKNEYKVYVHCKFGHGRSPTLVAAYFVAQGSTVEEALTRLKERRSVVHLRDSQIRALEEFKASL